jgi:hypothetical protein
MNYDQAINRMLKEAYFGGPYEKQNNVSRHIKFEAPKPVQEAGIGFDRSEIDTEFSQDKEAKKAAIEATVDIAVDIYNGIQDGDDLPIDQTTGKQYKYADYIIRVLVDNPLRQEGQEFTLPDMKLLFDEIGKRTTGKPPMSTEAYRIILKKALAKLTALLKVDHKGEVKEPFEDPSSDKYIGDEYVK